MTARATVLGRFIERRPLLGCMVCLAIILGGTALVAFAAVRLYVVLTT